MLLTLFFLNLIVSTLSILAVPHFLIGMVLISDVDCWIVSLVMLGELGNFLCDKSNSKKGVKLVHVRWSSRSQRTRQPCYAFRGENDDIVKPTTSPPTRRHLYETTKTLDGIRSWQKETNGEKETCDGTSMALLGLHECVYKEISYAPWLTLIERIPTKKGSRKIWGSSLQGKTLSAKIRMLTLCYYKNLKPLTNQDMHNSS